MPEPIVHTAPDRGDLQAAMSRDASVVRDAAGLRALAEQFSAAPLREVSDRRSAEDVALALAARTVTTAALTRTESRGCHHRAEYPSAATEPGRSILVRLVEGTDTVRVEALAAVG